MVTIKKTTKKVKVKTYRLICNSKEGPKLLRAKVLPTVFVADLREKKIRLTKKTAGFSLRAKNRGSWFKFWLRMARLIWPKRKHLVGRAMALRSAGRAVSAILVFSLISSGLYATRPTNAFYNDIEESKSNIFTAGLVDFTATSTPWAPITQANSMQAGSSTKMVFGINPGESNPFQYFASTTASGDLDFCGGISASLSQNEQQLYSGSLVQMKSATTTVFNDLELTATSTGSFYNKICDLGFSFTGWQIRHGFMEKGGFFDIENATATLSSWGLRLNKVYYDVKSPERGVEGDNEWVEIYNQTDALLDLAGWKICDGNSCDTFPAVGTTTIPAKGFAVVTASSTTWNYWHVPSDVTRFVLGGRIGNGLADSADMLVLKRPDGVIIDQMNWGAPNAGWDNYNSKVWHPGVPDVVEGNVLARVPSGFDTDLPSDWKELKPPSIDLIYPDEAGSYTWYWSNSYNIKWLATNPNGPSSALGISIFYIKDIDHDKLISLGDTIHTIATSTVNDGSYIWTVPSGFTGYIWIKLVATAPENPFLNTLAISGLIYDPIPLYVLPEGADPNSIDAEPPELVLNGNNPAYIPQGATYADLGVNVIDNSGNEFGYTTEGEVDSATLGEYTLTYTAVDQFGNTGRATRTVIVYDPAVGVPELSSPFESIGNAVQEIIGVLAGDLQETEPADLSTGEAEQNLENRAEGLGGFGKEIENFASSTDEVIHQEEISIPTEMEIETEIEEVEEAPVEQSDLSENLPLDVPILENEIASSTLPGEAIKETDTLALPELIQEVAGTSTEAVLEYLVEEKMVPEVQTEIEIKEETKNEAVLEELGNEAALEEPIIMESNNQPAVVLDN